MPNQEPKKSYKFFAPKVFIRTFGCQMNVRDSELVSGLLMDKGYRLVDMPQEADVILFNTCSVREHAENRVWGNLGMLRDLKIKRPDLIIGVIGCMAQKFKADIFRHSNLVDIVCGPSDEEDLPQLLEGVFKHRQKVLSVENVNKPRKEVFPEYRNNKISAYVSISHGCDNFCSYCIVPYVRGREISRKPENIMHEIKIFADKGIKEITLLGQNVNSYCRDAINRVSTWNFVKLLEEINKIDGIERIKFMTSHPKDAGEDLFKAMRDLSKVIKHLHLPLQSGSDKILKLMNRGYTSKYYLRLVEALRQTVSGCRLTSDIIVGFPGETKEDFEKTLDLMRRIKFDAAYIFKYSTRPPASSSKMNDDVPQEEKEQRHKALLELQRNIAKNGG